MLSICHTVLLTALENWLRLLATSQKLLKIGHPYLLALQRVTKLFVNAFLISELRLNFLVLLLERLILFVVMCKNMIKLFTFNFLERMDTHLQVTNIPLITVEPGLDFSFILNASEGPILDVVIYFELLFELTYLSALLIKFCMDGKIFLCKLS